MYVHVYPVLFIANNSLQLCENLEYLGGCIGNSCNNVHVDVVIPHCRKVFYAFQSAVLSNKGLDVKTVIYVFSSTCRSVLTYIMLVTPCVGQR